jgi:hypothetical protein
MKLIKIFLKYLNLKSKKLKTSLLSDTDNNFKFSKGDWVIIVSGRYVIEYFKTNPSMLKKPTGKVIYSEFQQKEPIYIVELYGGLLRFPESASKPR